MLFGLEMVKMRLLGPLTVMEDMRNSFNVILFSFFNFRVQGWDLYRKWMIWQTLLQRYASINNYANKDE